MNDTFLKACRGEKTDYTPVWMMRQAGRYLPDYQRVTANYDFLSMCRTPEIAAEVTMQPVDVLGVDAAIFFSDILTTVVPMGMELHYESGKGPSYANPLQSRADVEKLIVPDPEETLGFVYDAQRILARELASKVPLIGFAGSPFTVAAYMIEGKAGHAFLKLRNLLFKEPETFHLLMDKVSQLTAKYLIAQVKAGANALMLFDSHAGVLSPMDYLVYNLPYVKRIIAEIKSAGVPIIYFGLGQHDTLEEIGACGADVIGVDYVLRLDNAIAKLGQGVTVQGNIEPYVLFQPDQIEKRTREVLDQGRGARAHIFNLGHGVPQGTPPENARKMVEVVHNYR
jgi:uroporphyrinogen decarboxylase